MSLWTRITAAIVMLAVVGLQVASHRSASESEQFVRKSRRTINAIEEELDGIENLESLEGQAKLFELTRKSEREYSARSVSLQETVEQQRKLLLMSHIILGIAGFVIFGIGVAADDTGSSPRPR